jgi:quinolinate synthase
MKTIEADAVVDSGYPYELALKMGEIPLARRMELVRELKRVRRAVILAHNYQEGPIQEVADFIGDSLKLAQFARYVDEPVIVLCGVHFMAETAALLCPDKTVLIPDPLAGCSLADMVVPFQIRQWKARHPGGVVVCYINTSLAVKAECDICCTSSNGEWILSAIPQDKEILFVPDFYLGSYLKAKTGRKIEVWNGYCPAHVAITPEGIDRLRAQYPDAEFLMHPECGCLTKQMDLADRILSTDGMIQYVKTSHARRFIVATETGILYRMQKENPDKVFVPASPQATCQHMQRNTLDKVLRSLILLQHRVEVDPEVAKRARIPIQRMMEISERFGLAQPTACGFHRAASYESSRNAWDDLVLEMANDLS